MSPIMIAFAFLAGMVAGIVATFAFAAYLGGKRPRRAARRARSSSAGTSPSTRPGDKSVEDLRTESPEGSTPTGTSDRAIGDAPAGTSQPGA
jgi:hypothetical protein